MPVFLTTNAAEWYAVDGVYIAELDQPAGAQLDGNAGLTKMVGQFPWGPTDEIIEVGSSGEYRQKLLGNTTDPENYKGHRSIVGKAWGPLHIVRVSEASQAKASVDVRAPGEYTVGTYDGGDSYELTFSNVPNGPHTVKSDGGAGDHSAEDDVYTDLESKIKNHSDLGDVLAVNADTQNDKLLIWGDGDEDWSVSTNSAATGSHSFTQGNAQYTITGEYVGSAGNQIGVIHTQVDASNFKLTVVWGAEATTYGPYAWDGQSDTKSDINDDVDYIDFDWHANFAAAEQPKDQTNDVKLSGGADASLGASKSQPYIDGLDVLTADEDGGNILCAETELNETPNDAVIAKGQTVASGSRARYIHQSVGSSNTLDSRISKAGTYSDDRLIMPAHRVKQFIEGKLRTVDLAPFVASAMANSPPNKSPAAWSNREYFQAVRDFADGVSPTRSDYVNAVDQGALVLQREQGGVWKLRSGITTDTTSGKERIARRVMVDYVGINIGQALLPFQNEPPRPDVVTGAKAAMDRRLERMAGDPSAPESQLFEDFSTTTDAVNPDSVRYKVQVELWGELRHIIAAVQVGANVTISEEN